MNEQQPATPSPIRRETPGSAPRFTPRRLWERIVYLFTLALMRLVGALPPRPIEALFATLAPLAYLLWPAKRRIANSNAAVVLGVADPDGNPLPGAEAAVRARAIANYRSYGRFTAELLRLPSRSLDAIAAEVDLRETIVLDELKSRGQAAIFVGFHAGNNELGAASLGKKAYDVSVVADDTAFPEMYELLRSVRASWGIKVIDWRAIREVFGVMRRGGVLVLLIDWGWKPDGIPCQLFGRWTTLPSGPAVIAARGNAPIIPFFVRREAPGKFRILYGAPVDAGNGSPAAQLAATQATAREMEQLIRTEPTQWNCFKPLWPNAAEQRRLEELAAQMETQYERGAA
jgi:KDO2-lipid IV(A) lauroyltransferase